jgi:2,3-bisphosphoglycerate-dependent phosphoglycerate mutase
LNKQETVDKYGKDQVNVWRRSYDTPPPECDVSSPHYPANDPKYQNLGLKIRTESLSTTLDRVLPYWKTEIVPSIKSGNKVVIAAHGNSLRALVKYLDNIPEDVITELNIPTGVPLVYELDENFRPIPHPDAIAPLQGRYLGNQEEIKNRILGVKVIYVDLSIYCLSHVSCNMYLVSNYVLEPNEVSVEVSGEDSIWCLLD